MSEGRMPYARECSISGCTFKAHGRGWCSTHYRRWRLTGDPLKVRVWRPRRSEMVSRSGACLVSGCPDPRESKGYCHRHYYRLRKYGDAAAGRGKKNAPNGSGMTSQGYHFTTFWDGERQSKIATHRLVMEGHLGRPLLPTENVHHKN